MKKLDEILEFLFHTKRGIASLILGGISGTMLLGGCFVTDLLSCACDDCLGGCWRDCDEEVNDFVGCYGACDNTIFTALFGAGCTSDCGDCGQLTLSCNITDCGFGGDCADCSNYDCSLLGFNCTKGQYKDNTTIRIVTAYYDISTDSVYQSFGVYVNVRDSSIDLMYGTEYYTCYGIYEGKSTSSTQIADSYGSFINGYSSIDLSSDQTVYVLTAEKGYGETVTMNFSATVDGESISSNSDFNNVNISGSVVGTVGDTITGMPSAPTVTGYKFVGWYINGTQVSISNGDTLHLYNLGTTSRNVDVVAVYESIKYNVTIDVDGSTSSMEVDYGTTVGDIISSISASVEANYGKIVGLSYSKNSSIYLSADTVLVSGGLSTDTAITADCVLYVYYQEPVTITLYNANGPDSGSETITGYYFWDKYELSDDDISGYYFAGWYYDAACTKYVDTYTIRLYGTNYTYYAKWSDTVQTRVEYYIDDKLKNIIYYSYNPSAGTALWSDVDAYLPTGYELTGWCTDSSLSDTPTTVLPAGSVGAKKYYAKYAAKTYTVYLDANGGSVSSSTAQVTYGEDYWIYVPTRSGYVFEGWYYNDIQCTDSEGDSIGVFTEGVLGTTVNDGITFTARWSLAKASLEKTAEGQTNEVIITKSKDNE